MDLQPGAWLGEWVVEAPLGRGGFGRVYRARHADGRVAAVKVGQAPQDVRPAPVEHPHVVRTLEEHLDHEPPFVVLELVEGGSLRDLLARGPLPPPRALDVVVQLASALDHAHQLGVLHLDVKPENVLVDAARDAFKLADFGPRAERDAAPLAHSLPLTGDLRLAATRDYAAPEVREGTGRLDRRADVYSLGVLAFELLTGRLPLGLDRPSDLVPALPRAVDDVLARALARGAERRTLSAGALARELTVALSGGLGGPCPRGPRGRSASASDARVGPPVARSAPRRAPPALPVALALVVAALVGAALFQRLRPGPWSVTARADAVAARVAPLLAELPRGGRVVVLPPLDLGERAPPGHGRGPTLRGALEDAVARAGRAPAVSVAGPLEPATLFVRGPRVELAQRLGCEAALHAVLPPGREAEPGAARLFLIDLASWSILAASGGEGAAADLGRRAARELRVRGDRRPVAVLPVVDAHLGVSNRTTAWLDAELTAGLVGGSTRLPVRARAGIVEWLRGAGDVRRALSVGLALEGRLDARRGVLGVTLRDLDSGAALWSADAPLALRDYDVGRDMDRFTVDTRAVDRALGERLDRLFQEQVHQEVARALEAAAARLADGRADDALALLRALRGRGPAYAAQVEPLLLLARAHGARGDAAAELAALEEARALAPADPRVRDALATACLEEATRLYARGKRPWWRDDDEDAFREARAALSRLDGLDLEPARRLAVERLRRTLDDEL